MFTEPRLPNSTPLRASPHFHPRYIVSSVCCTLLGQQKMKGKITLEEAVTLPELAYQAAFHAPPGREDELISDLMDIHKQRLERMDKYGVEYMVLSITSPGAQGFGGKAEAEAFARKANDYLSNEFRKNSNRFGALCVLLSIHSFLIYIGSLNARSVASCW
jgi:predicted TIM-barrel fold metal-dependent hydrolase